LRLFHSMHDNVHGFDVTYEIDAASGRIERAESVTSRLPYAGICSEPQGRIKALVGETVDAGLRKRLSGHVGGVSGCAQLFDLTLRCARPRWFRATVLLPEGRTSDEDVTTFFARLHEACEEMDVALVGGHTEITYGLDRPIVAGTMLGEVAKDRLVTTGGALV